MITDWQRLPLSPLSSNPLAALSARALNLLSWCFSSHDASLSLVVFWMPVTFSFSPSLRFCETRTAPLWSFLADHVSMWCLEGHVWNEFCWQVLILTLWNLSLWLGSDMMIKKNMSNIDNKHRELYYCVDLSRPQLTADNTQAFKRHLVATNCTASITYYIPYYSVYCMIQNNMCVI